MALSNRWKPGSDFAIGLISSPRWEQDSERKRRPSNDRDGGNRECASVAVPPRCEIRCDRFDFEASGRFAGPARRGPAGIPPATSPASRPR